MSKINAMMPLKISGSYGVDDLRRSEILLQSLNLHMAKNTISRFDIVAPRNELDQLKPFVAKYEKICNFGLIAEDDLIPELADKRLSVRGWRKQMMLKLAYAESTNADFSLVFDADVVSKKNFGISNLLAGGKGSIQLQQILAIPNIPEWYMCSMSILGYEKALMGQGMSVTPAILSREICRSLAEYMLKRHRTAWWRYLIRLDTSLRRNLWPLRGRRDWSEYSLYFLHAEQAGLLWTHHERAGSAALPFTLLSDHSVWYEREESLWDELACFSPNDPGIFFVYQSSTGRDAAAVWSRIGRHLQPVPVGAT